jgi:hypothetical protein
MNKKIFAMLLLILNINILVAAGQKKDPTPWSVFQGMRTWEDAKNQCRDLNMRLPTLWELKNSVELGTTKDWEKYGNRYWSEERGNTFWSPSPQYKDADTHISITIAGAEESHRHESELGVFCINQNPINIVEGSTKEFQVFYPESFTTKSGLKFTKILMKDGKPVYVSDRIRPKNSDSWYFARDYGEKLNKEENCPNCYRLPYFDEIVNLNPEIDKQEYEGFWLKNWSFAPYGITFGNILVIIPWFGYSLDFIHDVIFHPLTWQSYIYFISPDCVGYNSYKEKEWGFQGHLMRSSHRVSFYYFPTNKFRSLGFRLVRPLR